jgi:hypothetical protein
MVYYQVLARFTFHQYKPALVSIRIKKQKARSFLVRYGLPFGSSLECRRFFKKKEAAQYVSYLHAVYKSRTVSNPAAVSGGQLSLF